jgi:hypothetical protein
MLLRMVVVRSVLFEMVYGRWVEWRKVCGDREKERGACCFMMAAWVLDVRKVSWEGDEERSSWFFLVLEWSGVLKRVWKRKRLSASFFSL